MPLQNRVTPFGDIVAAEARGTLMGNRGGRLHDPSTKTLLRHWASKAWICCRLDYNGQHHEPMGDGYTSLFFLDEVTALAAGHRPCFFCRRAEARDFLARLGARVRAPDFDRIAHADRLDARRDKRIYAARCEELPDGAIIAIQGGPHALKDGRLLRWRFQGYERALPLDGIGTVEVLTPRVIIAILASGYRPAWHSSAG